MLSADSEERRDEALHTLASRHMQLMYIRLVSLQRECYAAWRLPLPVGPCQRFLWQCQRRKRASTSISICIFCINYLLFEVSRRSNEIDTISESAFSPQRARMGVCVCVNAAQRARAYVLYVVWAIYTLRQQQLHCFGKFSAAKAMRLHRCNCFVSQHSTYTIQFCMKMCARNISNEPFSPLQLWTFRPNK